MVNLSKISWFLFLVTAATTAWAEGSPVTEVSGNEIVVGNVNSNELQILKLGRGQAGDITVHLASLGDMVDDFLVTLRRDVDNRRVESLLSDESGLVVFRGIPAGVYRVEVSRKVKEDGELSSTQVGDVRLSVSAINPRAVERSEDKTRGTESRSSQ